jgi:ribosomal protein S18 acetylase RimI-like enzyme
VREKTTWPWGVKGWYMVDGNGLIQQRRLSDREKADVVALAAACNAHEGLELKLNVDTPPDDDDAGGNDFLYYKDGTLAGYCALDIGSGVELCGMAHPAHRRRGIGRALLTAATAELRRRGVGKLLLICERNSRTGQAFVAATTAQYRFGESRMRLDLATFHSASPPDARLSVREAGREDIEPLTRTLSAAFDDPQDAVRARVERDLRDRDGWFNLARLDGKPIGALRVVDAGPTANIYAFGLLPAYRGRGLGRRFLDTILDSLRAGGYVNAGLEVELENANAMALYRSCGFIETTTYEYYALVVSPERRET